MDMHEAKRNFFLSWGVATEKEGKVEERKRAEP